MKVYEWFMVYDEYPGYPHRTLDLHLGPSPDTRLHPATRRCPPGGRPNLSGNTSEMANFSIKHRDGTIPNNGFP